MQHARLHELNCHCNKYKSIWFRACQACKCLNIQWKIAHICDVELEVGGDLETNRRLIFKTLRKHIRSKHTISLRDHPHQGKMNSCVAMTKCSCHFITTGKYTIFKDWRFIHRSWLGLFNKLNTYRVLGHTNFKCCKCPKGETLPHVIHHCMTHSTLMEKKTS